MDQLNISLRDLYASILNGESPDYDLVNLNFAIVESNILPTLPPDSGVHYEHYKAQQRFKHLKSLRRRYLIMSPKLKIDDPIDSIEENESAVLDESALKELAQTSTLLQTNEALTSKLQNVSAMMQSTILSSELNASELDQSTKFLQNLGERYGVFGDVLKTTGRLVDEINKAGKQERILIWRSIWFFVAVCVWILWKRIFKRPALLLIWVFWKTITFSIFTGTKLSDTITISTTHKEVLNTIKDEL
ncbi:Sec20 protein [Martiniozyma asiatica (nom. inval.)]|nr:Sec20 protein [Martiniozyma asiatica]